MVQCLRSHVQSLLVNQLTIIGQTHQKNRRNAPTQHHSISKWQPQNSKTIGPSIVIALYIIFFHYFTVLMFWWLCRFPDRGCVKLSGFFLLSHCIYGRFRLVDSCCGPLIFLSRIAAFSCGRFCLFEFSVKVYCSWLLVAFLGSWASAQWLTDLQVIFLWFPSISFPRFTVGLL